MLITPSIQEIPTEKPDLYAFRVTGNVTAGDMEAMSKRMLDAFDAHEKVDMLLKFEDFEGSELGSNLTWPATKAKALSLTNVDQYIVVGAPDAAATMIDLMGKIIPVEAKTYEATQERDAWTAAGVPQ